jgi:hypothetical protein
MDTNSFILSFALGTGADAPPLWTASPNDPSSRSEDRRQRMRSILGEKSATTPQQHTGTDCKNNFRMGFMGVTILRTQRVNHAIPFLQSQVVRKKGQD